MAAAEMRNEDLEICWINDASDEEQPIVFVPGVSKDLKFQTPFRLGPVSTSSASAKAVKMRAKHGSDSRVETPLNKGGKTRVQLQSGPSVVYSKGEGMLSTPAPICTTSPATSNLLPTSQAISETSKAKRQACLKDLCPEDKRRIANLIQELARVSEEKEESVQRLRDEQETFERKIQQLEQQNLLIVQERESLQQQYRECQELLGLYQQYLSQQQERLNQSITQLSQAPPHSKVSRSEGTNSRPSTSRANCSALDGSYLGVATAGARRPQEHRKAGGGRGAAKTFGDHASLSTTTPSFSSSSESECTPIQGPIKRQNSRKGGRSKAHSESHYRHEHHAVNGHSTEGRRTNHRHHLENGHCAAPEEQGCYRLPRVDASAMGPGAKGALIVPLLGHEDWEEKRHQLLLQKMQLEAEREKLQACLAQQEERLIRQNQQLRQSRLDYSRFMQATQTEHGSSMTRNGTSQPVEHPPNSHVLSSECEDAEAEPTEEPLCAALQQSPPNPLHNGIHTHEALQPSKKDMATSPVTAPARITKPPSVPVEPRTPQARLDSSLIELLEVFSPVSVPERSKPSTQKHKTSRSAHRPGLGGLQPAVRALLSLPGPYPQSPQQDLEESQILEDIFFIC